MSVDVYKKLGEIKLLPLYTATDLKYLDDLEEILLRNDVPFIEVTFRSNLALEAINKLSQSGKLIVGAGTVRTLEEAKKAIENGASFIVSPAVIPEIIEYCIENKVPVFPGTATPTDIQKVVSYGLHVVKYFPADIYGGLKAIKALSGPFYDVKFLPTGGINADNFIDYISNDNILAVGGSFIISEKMIKEDGKEKTSNLLKSLVDQIKA
ncbi:bifunctional 4-hydroxy-2-oxoglutarate aldolase/2-dehydro-3-deoxy-phosphogluconate aldolase [Clostridium beijerinckii]|jgi:2-keto-3-deoxy-phosphogluconate aldolase (EC 4.1.2.14)|uniref:Bifunctional 4-hydroxy-2-oxoglutarate aldolase/2-dehydro-3-deoxy-phosphogluconate aldolase n=2 Tax=Clostridium beijerinckii TaxID=1520 RepID=A0AAE2UZK2_CLOBE|nr:bifunctional 4-hydroxy-2-oxoglutarate aldolase/2-dehydro-3-deoxy-phosphogluconate aldolase [Clostridium beijerinckii]ABR34368.1 2-dehydro-3-deoxyphosphogluconate aldolase/4-hydroxy-2-oxoglutarate aldolase [Clostridium beijerinckii NCIMB 8052]AIU04097.1 2-dehydro-3-deoxyphosphogluconate aldolase/4-hydroxy-2-oxoglutarate aldolase [Clostridium beijerinckii ATCC 35702]ALB46592.1 bifunctional 4-hydroxy-2-oxoglutarate aldolase/2-dehydro-3-deoxy-phosphogluconate aldolase [Clostridium beijerinckii NR